MTTQMLAWWLVALTVMALGALILAAYAAVEGHDLHGRMDAVSDDADKAARAAADAAVSAGDAIAAVEDLENRLADTDPPSIGRHARALDH